MFRRNDAAVFPAVESNRDLGIAGADRRCDPNRAVQVAASATMFQFVMLFKRRIARMFRRKDHI